MTAPIDEEYEDTPEFEDAWEMLQYYLDDWGLGSLANAARDLLIGGRSVDVITLALSETPEYRQRFKMNEARKQNGLPALKPAEIVDLERQYETTLREFGLPEGFYDSYDDFVKFGGLDVSPQEIRDRAGAAQARYLQATTEERDQLERVLGTNDPSLVVAALLDVDRAMPILERQINTAAIAAEAQRAFRDQTRLSVERADELARAGVDQGEARDAFGELAGRSERDKQLARFSGQQLSDRELENELLFNDQDAGMRRKKALDQERARFGSNYLAQETGLRKDTSGSY